MKIHCPRPECSSRQFPSPKKRLFVRNGFFFRKSDSRSIRRYLCNCCGKQFSNSTFTPNYYQKQRRITDPLRVLMSSNFTQRRAALELGVTRKTISRRYRYLSRQGKIEQKQWLEKNYSDQKLEAVQFDDLETSEHTKCKPLSVCLAVDPKTYQILSFQVSAMPARGLLAKVSREKYGYRKDERAQGWNQMFTELQPFVEANAVWKSDDNPHYPRHLKKLFPKALHKPSKGGRGYHLGQGELKIGYDPLFAINHACAMLRANLSRLVRRTWTTTKNRQGLIDHLSIFVPYYNQVLKAKRPSLSPI
jgi:transposase-like protein